MPVTPSMPNDQRKSKNQKSWIHQSISWAGLNVLILHLKWRNVIPSFIVEFRQSASSWTPAACTKTICTHIWYSPAHFLEFVLICSERLDGSMPQCVPQLDFDQIPLCGYLVLNPIWVRLSNFEYWVLFNVMRFVVHLFENIQNNRKYSIKSRLVVPWNGSKPSESDFKAGPSGSILSEYFKMYENSIFSCKNHFCLDEVCEICDACDVISLQIHHFSNWSSDILCKLFWNLDCGLVSDRSHSYLKFSSWLS